MTHRFPIKEIARQAGLGTATVDRVLNNRAHVSPQTRARVEASVAELEAQERQLSARGRRMFVDVVVEAPQRFSRQVRAACEAVLPYLSEAVFRPRFVFQEVMAEDEIVAALERIKKRGSQGVILKARDVSTVADALNDLETAGIPVVTLVTDIPQSDRSAYVGIDNAKAGFTAAYMLANLLPESTGTVLTSRSQEAFQGEAERFLSFRERFLALRPDYKVLEISGGAGLSAKTKRRIVTGLEQVSSVDAVYSMGGGNRAILDALKDTGLAPRHFIAHDLDADNLSLLRQGDIGFVLHHDLHHDMRQAFRAISARHGLSPPAEMSQLSDVQIIAPYNIPGLVG
ncbi:LacI family DNA-binding transcriptional regulator [Aliiroseovarius sp. PrR006]|uniref:LacI family DNA-binding transcriptional regulator n=1 Tax=Aliiroseovarius sp. PrR006 TaxID=2706883 RepID=UPI0013D7E591|nr:LacI family DNA-binding transcriptional regulator [Aliiroseovarius sp. PrR006]NDW52474.1 substrate-binding domain-containing protein [Aliiroseovarius sp. PrR006]